MSSPLYILIIWCFEFSFLLWMQGAKWVSGILLKILKSFIPDVGNVREFFLSVVSIAIVPCWASLPPLLLNSLALPLDGVSLLWSGWCTTIYSLFPCREGIGSFSPIHAQYFGYPLHHIHFQKWNPAPVFWSTRHVYTLFSLLTILRSSLLDFLCFF